jgi:hypothetical protein
LVFQDHQEFDLRAGDVSRNVNPDAAGLNDMIPARTSSADGEVLTFGSRGHRGGRYGHVHELHARQCSFDQLWYKLSRTNFDQLYCPGNQFRVTDGRVNGEDPPGAVQAPLIGDIAFVEVVGDGAEWNGNTIRGRQQLEVRPDVSFEVGKALVQ